MDILRYNPDSIFSSLTLIPKLFLVLGTTVAIMFHGRWAGLLAISTGLLIALFVSGISVRKLSIFLVKFAPVMIIVFLIHLFRHGGPSLFEIANFKATETGAIMGGKNIVKLMDFVFVGILFIRSVSPVEFGRSVFQLARFLRFAYLKDAAIVFFVAIRFMPIMTREFSAVKLAIRIRGGGNAKGVRSKVQFMLKILRPLLAKVFRQSDDVATALMLKSNRGIYFATDKLSFRKSDLMALPLAAGLALALFWL